MTRRLHSTGRMRSFGNTIRYPSLMCTYIDQASGEWPGRGESESRGHAWLEFIVQNLNTFASKAPQHV